jgi:signal transduction histidine kinase
MNGVIGMTNLLFQTRPPAEQKQYAHLLKSSGEALLALINDILDFSKIEAQKLVLEQLVSTCVRPWKTRRNCWRSKRRKKICGWSCQIPPELPLHSARRRPAVAADPHQSRR